MKLRTKNVTAATMIAGAAALAWAGPTLAGDKAGDSAMKKGASAEGGKKGSAQGKSSKVHGKAVEHLPATCPGLAYVDVAGFATASPVAANEALIRERAKEIVAGFSEGKWSDATQAAKTTLKRLEGYGLKWSDVDEVALCSTDKGVEMMTIAGSFEGKQLVPALVSAGERQDEDVVTLEEKGGKQYAHMKVGQQDYYVFQVAPNVLGLAPKTETLDKATKAGAGMKARFGDAKSLAYVQTKLQDGRTVKSNFAPLANAHVLTTLVKAGPNMKFDPKKDKAAVEDALDSWASKLRDTPMKPIAEAIDRTPVTVTKNEIRARTVMANEDLENAIAASAKSQKADWNALFRGQTEVPEGIGGGPDGLKEPAPEEGEKTPQKE